MAATRRQILIGGGCILAAVGFASMYLYFQSAIPSTNSQSAEQASVVDPITSPTRPSGEALKKMLSDTVWQDKNNPDEIPIELHADGRIIQDRLERMTWKVENDTVRFLWFDMSSGRSLTKFRGNLHGDELVGTATEYVYASGIALIQGKSEPQSWVKLGEILK